MGESNGWIKLHRKLLDNPVMINAELLQLFIYCLLRANHADNEFIFNGKMIMIETGSFITGLHVLCKDLKQKQTSIYRRLQLLTTLGYLSLKTENKFTIITVLNYKTYQVSDFESGKPVENKRKTNGKPVETNNNDKNEKNDKNINIPFDMFWQSYDKKRGDKSKLERMWNSLTDTDRQNIMDYIPKYKIATPDKKYRKDPQTFFNNKSWNDELIGVVIPKPEKKLTLAEKDALFGEVAQ